MCSYLATIFITSCMSKLDSIAKSSSAFENTFKEANHRIKNNLQLILCLLNLQANEYPAEKVADFIGKGKSRLNTIFLIHDNFNQNNGFDFVNFSKYISDLIYFLIDCYNVEAGSIKFEVKIEIERLESEYAIALGLIVNEMISNSINHAFINSKNENKITIKLCKKSLGGYIFSYQDNGNAMIVYKEGLGFKIIELLTNQLDGKCVRSVEHGMKYEIDFPCME